MVSTFAGMVNISNLLHSIGVPRNTRNQVDDFVAHKGGPVGSTGTNIKSAVCLEPLLSGWTGKYLPESRNLNDRLSNADIAFQDLAVICGDTSHSHDCGYTGSQMTRTGHEIA